MGSSLHNLSADWALQDEQARHAWDRDGFVGEEPLWGRFWELKPLTEEQKALFLEIKSVISEDLDSYGRTAANYGLIHADLLHENVMLNGDAIALIDFDDAGFGWHMFEIATTLFWLSEEPEFETIQASLLAGYQTVRKLAERDLATLDLFLVARSLTYMGWVHTRSKTQTAIDLTPFMIENAEAICSSYLQNRA